MLSTGTPSHQNCPRSSTGQASQPCMRKGEPPTEWQAHAKTHKALGTVLLPLAGRCLLLWLKLSEQVGQGTLAAQATEGGGAIHRKVRLHQGLLRPP